MDAKVHPAHPVHHHRDAEEMFCPGRRHHRQEAAVASVDRVADPDAAVRHNFRELFPERDRDYRPSASAAAEACSVVPPAHRKLPLVADRSAGRAPGVQIVLVGQVVPVEKVVVHPDPDWSQEFRAAEHPRVAQREGAMAHQAAVPVDAEQELAHLDPPT